jgi:hypothetical protein
MWGTTPENLLVVTLVFGRRGRSIVSLWDRRFESIAGDSQSDDELSWSEKVMPISVRAAKLNWVG